MRAIMVINSKGGCGKTTIATNLAAYYAGRDVSTALLDYDRQGSSTNWYKMRPHNLPSVYGVSAFENQQSATRSWQLRVPPHTRCKIIDAPAGINGYELQELVRRVDVILIPVVPSAIDIHATSYFIRDLFLRGKVRIWDTRMALIANRVTDDMRVYEPLERFIKSLAIPFVTRLSESRSYVYAAEQGVSIHELNPGDVAAERAEWRPLLEWLDRQGSSIQR